MWFRLENHWFKEEITDLRRGKHWKTGGKQRWMGYDWYDSLVFGGACLCGLFAHTPVRRFEGEHKQKVRGLICLFRSHGGHLQPQST